MPAVTLREARLDDLELLEAWQTEPHVIAAGVGDDWQWQVELGRRPAWREQLIAEVDGRAIGFIQIIDPALEDSHYWGDIEPDLRAIDIWIGDRSALGLGYGSAMMRQALERCFAELAVRAVLVDPLASNARAQRFYRRFGFEFVAARRCDDDDCHVLRLPRERWRRGTPI